MPSYRTKQLSVLTMNTVGFTACFAIWVMFSVIGIPIKTGLNLSDTQFGLLAATPILTGSILRLPLGMMTDKFGGRPVYFWLMASVIIPLFLISKATEYWQFLVLGLFVGVAGASFAVGIAYTSRWFSKETDTNRKIRDETEKFYDIYRGRAMNFYKVFFNFNIFCNALYY